MRCVWVVFVCACEGEGERGGGEEGWGRAGNFDAGFEWAFDVFLLASGIKVMIFCANGNGIL